MLTRRWVMVSGLLLCGWLGTQIVSPLLAQQDAEPGKFAAPVAQNGDKELNVRYAQAYLKLMEAHLAELEDRNRRNPNTIRPAAIQLVQDSVGKARVRLKSAQNDGTNFSEFYVLRAEADLRSAEESLRKAEAVNKRVANTVGPGELARLNAQRDLARVSVEKARHLASETPLANMRFEIDQLRDDLLELRLQQAMARRGS